MLLVGWHPWGTMHDRQAVPQHHNALSASSGTPNFPATSATLANKAGINSMPGMRPWRYNGPNPDGWWCQDGVNCYVDPNNPYASQSRPAMIDREMSLMAALGVSTVRTEFDWPLIEPQKGVYDWSRADYIVNEAVKYGLQLQPILVYTPKWADGSLANSSNWFEVPPAQDSYWTDFVTQVVNRYKNSVHYWELWNEPDGGGYWYGSSGQGLSDFVNHIERPGYNAVKAADPTAQTILGPYFADTTWYQGVVNLGGKFDIAAFHDYTNDTLSGVTTLRSWLNGAGLSSTPIWIGEYSSDQGSGTTNDTTHINTFSSVLKGSGYQMAQWYELRDDIAMNCCPPSGTQSKYWGIVGHDDTTIKQGYTTMQSLIGGASPTSTPGPTATANATARPTATIAATARPTATIALPTATPQPTPKGHKPPTPTPVPPTPTSTPAATPTSTPALTPTATPALTPKPTPTNTPGSGPLYSDGFESDAVGAIPTGWTVYGSNAGFAVASGNGGHVYGHNGWTATTLAGSTAWSNYTLSVRMLPNNWASEQDGIIFRARDSNNYYALVYNNGTTLTVRKIVAGASSDVASVSFTTSSAWHTFTVAVQGSSITASVDGTVKLTANDSTFSQGEIGLMANSPVQFDNVTVQ